MLNNYNAHDLQISLLSTKSVRDLSSKMLMIAMIFAWILATLSVTYAVGLMFLLNKSIESFVVSQSGEVVKIQPINQDLLKQLLEKK